MSMRLGRFGLSSLVHRAALALGLAALSPALLATSGSQSLNFESRVLAAHNRERATLGIAPLRWNPSSWRATPRPGHSI